MNNKISFITVMLGIILTISACQSAEEKAGDANTADTAVNTATQSIHLNEEDTVGGSVSNDTMTAVANTTKAKRGTAKVVMVGSQNAKAKIEAGKDGVYARAQVMPSFPGGQRLLVKFVEDNLQYPREAINDNIEGRVVVSFDVDENGKIYNPVTISKKIGYGLEEEAIRVVKAMPKWNPGKVKGKNVKTKFNLPILYYLEQ